jgi:hypothetical protein
MYSSISNSWLVANPLVININIISRGLYHIYPPNVPILSVRLKHIWISWWLVRLFLPNMNTDHRAGKINEFFLPVKNIPDSVIMSQQITNKLSKPPSIWLCCQPRIKSDNKTKKLIPSQT